MSHRPNKGPEELGPDEERELVRRAQDGDQAAMEQLLSACQDRVYRTALTFTAGDEESAFELSNEVLVSAYRHITKFRGNCRLHTWLYRITSNLAKNRFVVENRERARFTSLDAPRRSDSDDSQPRDWADRSPDTRTLAADREKLALLLTRLETLEHEWREVLVLRFFEDLSYDEIADVLDVPVGTVKSRLNRARRALRDAMGDLLQEGMR
jgi:RNA polymerase sigma-70 factor (ECF subfamily)